MRFGLCYLSLASRRKTKEVLSFVCSRFDADPASLLHSVQCPSQCCTVHYETFAEPVLIHLAGFSQRHKQSELCNLKVRPLQFLVINPRYDSRCATKVLASARQVKEPFCGGRFRCCRPHNICIYNYLKWPSNSLRPSATTGSHGRLRTIRKSGSRCDRFVLAALATTRGLDICKGPC